VRRADLVGLCLLGYIGLLVLGSVMAVADFFFWDDSPSSTSSTVSTAGPTTVSTIAAPAWTTVSSVYEPSRTTRTVPRSFYEDHYRIGARCRDGWRSHATGSGACSSHGGVAEWLYADDRIVHDAKTGREIGTVKWVGAYAGRELQRLNSYSLSFDELAAECDRTFTHWKRQTDMRERDRNQFVYSCQLGG
jgi:hypothetical protein